MSQPRVKRKSLPKQTEDKANPQLHKNSYAPLLERFKELALSAAGLPVDNVYNAFMRAGYGMANLAPLQNQRVKALNPLPFDYTKTDLNGFLRSPTTSEKELRQIAEGLRWTTYPFQKIAKSYSDMLAFRHYEIPLNIDEQTANSPQFKREWRLVVNIVKAFMLRARGRTITHQALIQGKVFYSLNEKLSSTSSSRNKIYK